MVTQKLTIRLDESELPDIRMVSGDIGREIQIEVYAREDSENPIDLETYSAEITLIKPDNTFIMDNFTIDKYELPEQAGAVSGSGYYQIKIFTAGDHQIYTGQGRFLVDDMILSDDVIESSSIAFGDRFPEDFATKTWVDDEIEAHGIGTYVAGNPAGEETMPPLVRLQINEDIYPISHKIEEMEDADITDPAAGDVLTYDADDQKWKNEPLVIPDPTVTKTATGNPIEISDGADAPLVKCITQIQGYQSGSGTPSPDNIRPIVAYTEGEIEVRGRNMIPPDYITHPNDTAIRAWHTGSGVEGTFLKAGTYTFFSDKGQANGLYVNKYDNGTATTIFTKYNATYFTFTLDEDTDGISLYLYYANGGANNYGMMLVEGSYSGDYEEYKGTTHTTTYPSAIYRGSEDCVRGEVTTEWGMIASYAGETLPGEWISDRDEYAPGTTPTTGAQVAYELATPTTSSVTPTNLPIKSLSGYSHIESTTGEMEVEYITQQWDAIMTAAKLDNLKVYSTAEHVVGKWVDGKDIYEQTFVLSNEITLAVNQWNSITGVSLSGVETPIDVEIRSSRGTSAANVDFIDSPVSVWGASGTEKVKSITFRYTKTS